MQAVVLCTFQRPFCKMESLSVIVLVRPEGIQRGSLSFVVFIITTALLARLIVHLPWRQCPLPCLHPHHWHLPVLESSL